MLIVDKVVLKYRWCVHECFYNQGPKKSVFKSTDIRVDKASMKCMKNHIHIFEKQLERYF